MPDPIFAEARLAALYDVVDDDRRDLDLYVDIVAELGAASVVDIGCGTGTLACRLALAGIDVVGVDPAIASLDIARCKPGAGSVRWIHSDATGLPPLAVDLAVMTGNVAQVFLTDAEWEQALAAIRRAITSTGWLVLETRNPARRAWEHWTKQHTRREIAPPGIGTVITWTELLEVDGPLVSFRHVFHFAADGVEMVSDSTLRFRDRAEIEASLDAAGFALQGVRDAPDRPGLEHVYIARSTPTV